MEGRASAIMIKNVPEVLDYVNLLNDLGFASLTKMKDKPFEEALNPENDKVYIGKFKNNLIICAPDIAMKLIDKDTSVVESTLIKLFPKTEIFAFVFNSFSNLWGYSIIKNGEKIRSRAGSAESGTFFDIGEPLEQEKELYSKSVPDNSGNRLYYLDEFPNEPLSEDKVGDKFINAICSRYLGKALDRTDNEVYLMKMHSYIFNTSAHEISTTGSYEKKHWWRFW